tara:strand:+ start:226 stop:855 length:630 start_codon:yes stop_codon:yes gene_type:complete
MHTATLVSITPDAEELIAYCARVSNPANQNNTQTASRLLKYLIKHRHWSPFEMANMVVEIKTNRAIAAQILRHRSFSFQEFSQRYAEVQSIPTPPYLRRQDTKNRQNSIDDLDVHTKLYWQNEIDELYHKSQDVYQRMLKQGIAKECAREVLPIGSDTTLYMNGTIRSWLHYIDLRASPETQLEHRRIAEGCKMLINDTMPDVYEAMWM